MANPIKIDRDMMLDMWARGDDLAVIARAVGSSDPRSTLKMISEERVKGDPRAVRRANGGAIIKQQMAESMNAMRRRRKLANLPVNIVQIEAAVQRYTGPVKRLPPAVHAGHVPACLRALGY